MSDRIVVTPAQVLAARMQIELAKELGETVSPLVRRIAEARPRPKAASNGSVGSAAEAQSPAPS